jgi:hypothetical protein
VRQFSSTNYSCPFSVINQRRTADLFSNALIVTILVLDKTLAAITIMMYRTVDVYSDRTSQLAVESFVAALLGSTNAALVSSFLTAFLKRFSLAMSALVKQPAAKR